MRRTFLKSILLGSAALVTHVVPKPRRRSVIIQSRCVGCGDCVRACPVKAISLIHRKAHIDQDKCVGCKMCVYTCSYGAPR